MLHASQKHLVWRIGAWLALALTASPHALAAAPGVRPAPIARVVLYPGSALVERVASLQAGASQLEIAGIPANFDTRTLEIEADSGIEVGQTVWRDNQRSAPLNAEEARLEAEIRRLEQALAQLDIQRSAAELELKFLDGQTVAGDGPRPANPAAVLKQLREGSIAAQERLLEANRRKPDIERELAARRTDLQHIKPAVDSVRTLSIRLRAQVDGKLRIRYQLNEAGWRPAYKAVLNTETGQLELERTAQIAQRSGEDWSQVALRLSTGQPRQNVSGPQPAPWNLSLRPELPPEAAMPLLERRAMPAAPAPAMYAKANDAAGREPLFQVAVEQGEYTTEYAVAGNIDLPSDGRKLAVSLGRLQMPVRIEAQTAPRLDKTAYLVARGKLPEGVWPAGEIQLYRNGAYVGTAPWDATRSKQLELPFGRDELIKVGSRSLAAQSGNSGFVGQQAERRLADVFTVSNGHRRPVDIVVLEASPVGRDDKIEVGSNFVPPISRRDWNDRPGVVAWEKTLAPGASQDFSVDYRIQWPKERRILGLP